MAEIRSHLTTLTTAGTRPIAGRSLEISLHARSEVP